jgi:hypothetical protein
MAKVLADAGAGSVYCFNDEAGIEKAVREAWSRFRTEGNVHTDGNIEQYSRTALTKQLAALLNSITENK